MALKLWLVASMVVAPKVRAWEFPPTAVMPQDSNQRPLASGDDDVDIVSGSQFHGLRTFANLPYLNCFSDAETAESRYDIAIMGAPFDTVRSLLRSCGAVAHACAYSSNYQSVTGRPGARYGPTGIRIGSQRMHRDASYSIYTGPLAVSTHSKPLTRVCQARTLSSPGQPSSTAETRL